MKKDKFEFLDEIVDGLISEQGKKEYILFDYTPNPKQGLFHESSAKIRFFIAGNRAGKTFAGAHEAVWHALGNHPHRKVKAPNKGWIVSLDYPQSRDVVQPTVFELIPTPELLGGSLSKAWNKQDQILKLRNGSIIGFKSCESGREKFQGADKDWIWFDEEPPEDVWKECRARIPGGGRTLTIWGTLTPLKGFTWVYHQIYKSENPDIQSFSASIYDNSDNLPEKEVKDFEESLTPHERESRIHGRFGLLAGSPMFSPEVLSQYMERTEEPIATGRFSQAKKGAAPWLEEILFVKDVEEGRVVTVKGCVEIYEYPRKFYNYVVGADPSEGVRDRSVATVLSKKDFRVVAKIRGLLKPDEFGEQLSLLGRFYNNALLGVESNPGGSGQTVIRILKEKHYPRLYRQKTEGKRWDKTTENLGWRTSKKTKPTMIQELERVIREKEIIIPSKDTLEELTTYIITEDNTYQAQSGCFDDEVIALAICYQVYKSQPNYLGNLEQWKPEHGRTSKYTGM